MRLVNTSCIKSVGGQMECRTCSGKLIRHGFSSAGKVRYKCKYCNKTQQEFYSYMAYCTDTNQHIKQLIKEGVGIRSISRILKFSTTTLLKRIVSIANAIQRPIISKGKEYEVDEMRTFLRRKSKLIWIAYALERKTKDVVSFSVGKRTNKTLYPLIRTLELSNPKVIYTDGLRNYKCLVPAELHKVKQFGTNHIERKNLSLRTHLKRLNRKTICFSRSLVVLKAVLMIYFWG